MKVLAGELISGVGKDRANNIIIVSGLNNNIGLLFALSFIEVWCNGNTEDFGSSISGSNPDTSTTITNVIIGNVFIV